MKHTFILVGLIAACILAVVLLLNAFPELTSYKLDNSDYNPVTKQNIPELKLSIVTSEQSFWDQVKSLNGKQTTAPSDGTAVISTDENGNEIPSSTDTENSDEETTDIFGKKEIPVTTVPDTEAPDYQFLIN